MIRLILILLFIFAAALANAQAIRNNSDFQCYLANNEKVYIDLDRRLLVAGDYLHYKAYLVNASSMQSEACSKIIYYEIIDPNFKVMHVWRSNVKNGISVGETLIPDTIPEGMYQLRAFTNWMRNKDHLRYFTTSLIIVSVSEDHQEIFAHPVIQQQEIPNNDTAYENNDFSIQIQLKDEIVEVIVTANSSEMNPDCNLVISSRGRSIVEKNLKTDKGKSMISVPSDELPAGVLKFEVINSHRHTLVKSLYYNPVVRPEISLKGIQNLHNKNEKIAIELSIPELNETNVANLSMSVIEKSPFDTIIKQSTLEEYFVLNSEFGYPASFSFDTSIINSGLIEYPDYSDYEWNAERLDHINHLYMRETRGYILSGKIGANTQDTNFTETNLFLSKPDSVVNFKFTSPSSDGTFHFPVDAVYDNEILIIQEVDGKIQDADWMIENKWEHPGTATAINNFSLNESQKKHIKYMHQVAMVKRIYDNSYHVPDANLKSSIARSFYIPSYIVHPVEFEELPNFEEITANLLPAVRFRSKKGKYILSFYIKDFEKVFTDGVGLFLNGIPFSNLEYIASLSSLDIDRIEVCNKQVMHGDITYNGIVSIYTFDPAVQPSVIKNPFLFVDNRTNSISGARTELHGLPGNSPIDNCLYWNPDIILRGNESVELEFKTLNIESEYRLQINGISDLGTPFSEIVDFKVQ